MKKSIFLFALALIILSATNAAVLPKGYYEHAPHLIDEFVSWVKSWFE